MTAGDLSRVPILQIYIRRALPDGTIVQPTNKRFHIDFCTVAHWNEQGQIVEENLFYDLMGMLKQSA